MQSKDKLVESTREHVKRRRGISERNMFCGTIKHELVLRLGNEGVAKALNEPHTNEMDFTGKVIKSMI